MTSFAADCTGRCETIRAKSLLIGDILHSDDSRAQRIGAVCSIWGIKLDLLLLVSVYKVARQKYANATTSSDGLSTAAWRKKRIISQ